MMPFDIIERTNTTLMAMQKIERNAAYFIGGGFVFDADIKGTDCSLPSAGQTKLHLVLIAFGEVHWIFAEAAAQFVLKYAEWTFVAHGESQN